jgi:hypothetical protein
MCLPINIVGHGIDRSTYQGFNGGCRVSSKQPLCIVEPLKIVMACVQALRHARAESLEEFCLVFFLDNFPSCGVRSCDVCKYGRLDVGLKDMEVHNNIQIERK